MSPLESAGFFVPLALLVILWKRRAHFGKHKIALATMLAITLVAILHFDVGMLGTDPYARFLREIDAPRRFWRYFCPSVAGALLLGRRVDVPATKNPSPSRSRVLRSPT